MTEEVKQEEKLIKIDLGCGDNKRAPEYIGVDFVETPSTDVVHDLKVTPWPWEDNSVDEVYCSHFVEHLTGKERIAFMNEVYRVLKPGKHAFIITPHWSSLRAYGDPTHQWPPISEFTFMYFNKGWRETNKLTHGDYSSINCNFDFTYGYSLDPDISIKNPAFQQDAAKYKVNAINDIFVTLTKI